MKIKDLLWRKLPVFDTDKLELDDNKVGYILRETYTYESSKTCTEEWKIIAIPREDGSYELFRHKTAEYFGYGG